jgi:hypothetical protein
MFTEFIKKVFLLIVLIMILSSVFVVIYHHQTNRIEVDKNIHILICGDSHTECALNDSILKNSINISKSAEAYIYSYNVIKVLTKNNSHINTIILGFSFHNLTGLYDCVIFETKWTKFNYPEYLSILDLKSLSVLLSNNISGVAESISSVYRKMFYSISKKPTDINSWPFIGKYFKSNKCNVNDTTIKSAIAKHYYKKFKAKQEFSSIQEKYLKLIVQYCIEKHIKIVLLNTPLNIGYYKKIPDPYLKKYYAVAKELKNKALIYDFHDLKLDNECYGDGDHINESGAEILTLKIDSLMDAGINNYNLNSKNIEF